MEIYLYGTDIGKSPRYVVQRGVGQYIETLIEEGDIHHSITHGSYADG